MADGTTDILYLMTIDLKGATNSIPFPIVQHAIKKNLEHLSDLANNLESTGVLSGQWRGTNLNMRVAPESSLKPSVSSSTSSQEKLDDVRKKILSLGTG